MDTPPFMPAVANWAGIVIIVIAGLFLAAASIGMTARAVMPEKYDG